MRSFTIAGILLGALTLPLGAQDYEADPGQGVARLSVVNGDVVVQRGDSGEFIAGERNAPLVARDHVTTGDNARAEIQFDWANMIRMAPNSEIRLAELEEGNFFIQVADGTTTFSVLRDSSSLVEISTPTVSLRPRDNGAYRIMVRPDGSTQITVRSGEAEIYTAGRTEILTAGRTMEVSGNPAEPELVALAAIPRDEWDRWNDARDNDLERSDSYRYVSRDIYGADDLAGHGRWVYDSPYGWVWAPRVPATWTPYRAGRWSWVNHYGWTWISSDPWGWAPYHYGRWYNANSHGWVWYPGAIGSRHPWRPALVAFFGWGSGVRVNVGLTFGFRNVGWVPLAPYEVYRPWYGRGLRTHVNVNNITVVNNINIVKRYRNARFYRGRNGVTSVPTGDFGRNRVTANNFVRVRDRDLSRTGEIRGRMPFEPSRAGRQFSDRSVAPQAIPRGNTDDRQFVSRRRPGDTGDSATSPRGDGTTSPRVTRGGRGEPVVYRGSRAPERGADSNDIVTAPSIRGGNSARTDSRSERRANRPVAPTNPQAVASPRRTPQPRTDPGRVDRRRVDNNANRQRGADSNRAATAPSIRGGDSARTDSRSERRANTPVAPTNPQAVASPRRTPRPRTDPGRVDRRRIDNNRAPQRGADSNRAVTAPSVSRGNNPIARTNPSRNSARRSPERSNPPAVQNQNRVRRALAPRTRPAPEIRRAPEAPSQTRPSAAPQINRSSQTRNTRNSNIAIRRGGPGSGGEVRSSPGPRPSAPAINRSTQRGAVRGNSGAQGQAPRNIARPSQGSSNVRSRGRR